MRTHYRNSTGKNLFRYPYCSGPVRACVLSVVPLFTGTMSVDVCSQTSAAFWAQGGPRTTQCIGAAALQQFAAISLRKEAGGAGRHCLPAGSAALVIGGNKGDDCAGWARLLSGDDTLNASAWRAELNRHITGKVDASVRKIGSSACVGEYPLARQSAVRAHVFCVEALPANSRVLGAAVRAAPWSSYMTTIAAAAVSPTQKMASGTVPFPNWEVFGFESIGLGSRPGIPDAQVEAVTVDDLVRSHMSGFTPAVLTVDTEGNDPEVLLGSKQLLASGSVGFLQFEVHSQGAWRRHLLRETIDMLDNHSYTCFWATQSGALYRITGCWEPRYDQRKIWSNIICADRRSACWTEALERAAYKPNARATRQLRSLDAVAPEEWASSQKIRPDDPTRTSFTTKEGEDPTRAHLEPPVGSPLNVSALGNLSTLLHGSMLANLSAECCADGRVLMKQTRAWLSVPSSSNRPAFETCLQGRRWPLGPTERRVFHEALQRRCHWVNGLDSSVAWVALDCGGYGHSQPPGRRHDNGSLARCAPAHVSIACVTCSTSDLRPGIDMGFPPISWGTKTLAALRPNSTQDVEQRCLFNYEHRFERYPLATFRGSFASRNNRHSYPYGRTLGLWLLNMSRHNVSVPGWGHLQVTFTDFTDKAPAAMEGAKTLSTNSYEEDFLKSQFILAPRGHNLYSMRAFEAMSMGVIPIIISDDWVLPFEEVINWSQVSVRLSELELESLPARLASMTIEQVCQMRKNAFEAYRRYLESPAAWEAGIASSLAARRRSSAGVTLSRAAV